MIEFVFMLYTFSNRNRSSQRCFKYSNTHKILSNTREYKILIAYYYEVAL